MLGTWLAVLVLSAAPTPGASETVAPAGLRDLGGQLEALDGAGASPGAARAPAGLRDPFSTTARSAGARSATCTNAEQAKGDRSMRCRARLQTPFS